MNADTIAARRRRIKTNHFIVLVIVLLVLLFGSFFLLRPVIKQTNTPVNTVQRFVGFVELNQYDSAYKLLTPTFQNQAGWHGTLFSFKGSIDPAEASYHLLNQKGDLAEVQFSAESGGALYVKKVDGKWLIASPSEVPSSTTQTQAGS